MSDEFVNAMQQGNNIEAEKVFTQSMASKVGDTLEAVSYTHLTLPTILLV